MAPVESRNVRSIFLTSCMAVIFGLICFCFTLLTSYIKWRRVIVVGSLKKLGQVTAISNSVNLFDYEWKLDLLLFFALGFTK